MNAKHDLYATEIVGKYRLHPKVDPLGSRWPKT